MSIAIVRTDETVFGNKRVAYGTYSVTGGDTTGAIITGLQRCEHCQLTGGQSTIVADAPTVSSISGGTVNIIVTANTAGYWFAMGT
jgi:hypothetical protein